MGNGADPRVWVWIHSILPSSHHCKVQAGQSEVFLPLHEALPSRTPCISYSNHFHRSRENHTLNGAPSSLHATELQQPTICPCSPIFPTFGRWFLFALFSSLGLARDLSFSVLPSFKPWFPKILVPLPPSSHKGSHCFSTRPLDSRFSSASSEERYFVKLKT